MTTLILGATSDIAQAVANRLAARGHDLHLVARSKDEAGRIASDLAVRHGVTCSHAAYDIMDGPAALEGDYDGIFVAVGYLGDYAGGSDDAAEVKRLFDSNLTGVAATLEYLAPRLPDDAWVAVIGSVAGDRGRQSNYLYGAAKAGLAAYLSGLRNRLQGRVHVLTIKPGFVDTAMTHGKEGMFLVASPDRVAKSIVKAIQRRRNVVYTPWFWRPVLWIIRAVPEPIFKRLRL